MNQVYTDLEKEALEKKGYVIKEVSRMAKTKLGYNEIVHLMLDNNRLMLEIELWLAQYELGRRNDERN